MATLPDNPAFIEHDDLVGVQYRTDSLGDNNQGAIGMNSRQFMLYSYLCVNINGTRTIIKNQNSR